MFDINGWLSEGQACNLLKLRPRTLRYHAKKGRITRRKKGNRSEYQIDWQHFDRPANPVGNLAATVAAAPGNPATLSAIAGTAKARSVSRSSSGSAGNLAVKRQPELADPLPEVLALVERLSDRLVDLSVDSGRLQQQLDDANQMVEQLRAANQDLFDTLTEAADRELARRESWLYRLLVK